MKRANNSHTTTSSSTSSTLHTILLATCFLTATKEGEAAETTSLVKTGKKIETSSMSNWVKLQLN